MYMDERFNMENTAAQSASAKVIEYAEKLGAFVIKTLLLKIFQKNITYSCDNVELAQPEWYVTLKCMSAFCTPIEPFTAFVHAVLSPPTGSLGGSGL